MSQFHDTIDRDHVECSVGGALIVADHELETILEMDNFTLEDRKELIKQGIFLEQFHKEIHDLKVSIRESLIKLDQEKLDRVSLPLEKVANIETRVSVVERSNDRLTERIKSILWVGGFIITLVQVIAELSVHILSK